MNLKVQLDLANDAVFFEGTAPSSNVKVKIDGPPSIGGQELGVRPMELVLLALASCSSLDFVSILRKQKQVITEFHVETEGERRELAPNIFTKIHLTFYIKGEIDQTKADRAAELAVKKYCSVHDMLAAGGISITYSVNINS